MAKGQWYELRDANKGLRSPRFAHVQAGTALNALKKYYPGVHIYSRSWSGNATQFTIDREPWAVWVVPVDLGPMTIADDGTVKQNPERRKMASKKKPTAAQLAARAAFTAAVKSGAFKRKRKANPLTRVKVNSPPQRPAGNSDEPSARLKKRRRVTAKAPKGVYANPHARSTPTDSEPLRVLLQYFVQWLNTVSGKWRTIAAFANDKDAMQYARAWADTPAGRTKAVRVATAD